MVPTEWRGARGWRPGTQVAAQTPALALSHSQESITRSSTRLRSVYLYSKTLPSFVVATHRIMNEVSSSSYTKQAKETNRVTGPFWKHFHPNKTRKIPRSIELYFNIQRELMECVILKIEKNTILRRIKFRNKDFAALKNAKPCKKSLKTKFFH